MIDLGYNDPNAFRGLKTLTIALGLYFTRVLFSLIVGIFIVVIR